MWRETAKLCLALVALTNAAGQVRADDQVTALRVIDGAIRAAGGEERLVRANHMLRNAKGTLFFFGKEIAFTTQLTMDLPERIRDVIEVEADNKQKNRIVRVVTRDQAWTATNGATVEMAKPEAEEVREEVYILWLTTLQPLRDPTFHLAPLPEIKVDGRPATGVRVSRAGHGDAALFFDKQSSRLVKIERQAREVGLLVNKEYFLSEPREFEGITRATKQVEFVSGKKSTELVVTLFAFPAKMEDNSFAKP